MLLIPAIDLKGGRCVRLRQGRMDEETVFSDDPLAVAQRWVDAGTRRLHIVDLDGAASGRPENAEVIHAITERFPEVPVQVGGGIRDDDTGGNRLDAVRAARDVVLGLNFLHERGIAHLGLHTENLLLADRSTVHCKLSDFGAASRPPPSARPPRSRTGTRSSVPWASRGPAKRSRTPPLLIHPDRASISELLSFPISARTIIASF